MYKLPRILYKRMNIAPIFLDSAVSKTYKEIIAHTCLHVRLYSLY
jgi:fibrillarin-like rRNA methylase